MSWLYVFLGLMALIMIHELGHLLAAKATKIGATEFSVGFGPAIIKRSFRGVEYRWSLLPLGGYVRIVGMLRPEADEVAYLEHIADYDAAAQEPLDQLAAAIGREDWLAVRAQIAILRELYSPYAPDSWRQRRRKERTLRRLEHLEQALGHDAYWRAATWRRIVTIIAGPLANIALGVGLLFIAFNQTGAPALVPTVTVAAVTANSPAQQLGIQPGDRILSVNNVEIKDYAALRDALERSQGFATSVVVARGADALRLGPAPLNRTDDGYRLGIELRTELGRSDALPASEAARFSLTTAQAVTTGTVAGIAGTVQGGEERNQLSSIVGIAQIANDSISSNTFWQVLGIISLALALFNLLPVLPLDGGHIAVAAWERVTGIRLSRRTMDRASFIGLSMVMVLFSIGFANDMARIFG